MLLEWETHTRSHSPNTPVLLLELGGSGACQALVYAGVCAGSQPAEQRCSQPCLDLPQETLRTSISHHLFGLLINCNCSSLSATWQAKEIYGHHPTSPVSPAVCRGAELLALTHLPQSLGSPPSLRYPRTSSPGPCHLQQITKEKQPDTLPLLTWWLWSPGWQKNPVGFYFRRQRLPTRILGCCAWHPSLAWGC